MDGKNGRERDNGARINEALKGQSSAADPKLLTSALCWVSRPRPPTKIASGDRFDKI
jgi:hypothetical protein